jgi:Holliday junction resolvase RusA-like endonuclease
VIIEFNIDPMGAVRQNRSDAWKGRPCVLRYWAFKDSLRVQAAPYELPSDPLIVNLTFYIRMPDSWSKKKKEAMRGTYHRQKPDRDNLEKGVFDALWRQDSMIADGRTTKWWAYEGSILMEVFNHG